MKSYRTAIAALVLTLAFSTPAFADGIMWTGKTPPPPPPTNGIMWTGTAFPAPEGDVVTEIVLTLLQTLIPLV
jgi:hypothetical protein